MRAPAKSLAPVHREHRGLGTELGRVVTFTLRE